MEHFHYQSKDLSNGKNEFTFDFLMNELLKMSQKSVPRVVYNVTSGDLLSLEYVVIIISDNFFDWQCLWSAEADAGERHSRI